MRVLIITSEEGNFNSKLQSVRKKALVLEVKNSEQNLLYSLGQQPLTTEYLILILYLEVKLSITLHPCMQKMLGGLSLVISSFLSLVNTHAIWGKECTVS